MWLVINKAGTTMDVCGSFSPYPISTISSQWWLCRGWYQYSYSPKNVSSLTARHCITWFGFLEKLLETVKSSIAKLLLLPLDGVERAGEKRDYWRLLVLFSLYYLSLPKWEYIAHPSFKDFKVTVHFCNSKSRISLGFSIIFSKIWARKKCYLSLISFRIQGEKMLITMCQVQF